MHSLSFYLSQLQGGNSFFSTQVDGQKFDIAQMVIIIITKTCNHRDIVTYPIKYNNITKLKTIDVINL